MSKLICLQMGHSGLTTGATGAPGEKVWLEKVVPMVADILRKGGHEVYVTNALANKDAKVTTTDWDLFLACHSDADIYNDRGGFIDIPDPSVDASSTESARIADAMRRVYFTETGIPEKPQRSNANTKFYYMWQYLTANTPCVLIECGIGNRKPEDYTVLRDYNKIASTLASSIVSAFSMEDSCEVKLEEAGKALIEMRESRNKWRTDYEKLEDRFAQEIQDKNKHIELMQQTMAEQGATITSLSGTIQTSSEENGRLLGQRTALEQKIVVMTTENDIAIKAKDTLLEANLVRAEKAEKSVKDLKEKLALQIVGYSKWELFKELFTRR